MSEVIASLDFNVIDQRGREYYVNVAAELTADAQWEVWLEFLPFDDTEPLLTDTETTQPTRSAIAHWATTLTEAYVRASFERATLAEALPTARTATSRYEDVPLASAAVIDPFELLRLGKDVLRMQLQPLSRAELLTVIVYHELNPARLSLAWLSTSQLVTFIVTATEAQVLQGRR
jgi:hypothetical protein